jgi:hypothetical protein
VQLVNGVASVQVTLKVAHTVTLTATSGGLTATSSPIAVSPAAPVVTLTTPAGAQAGASFSVTIKAVDPFGNAWTGPVTLTSSDGETVSASQSR